uniref:AT-hook motif nuclear-localized protein n=1 Tax=Oryza brachyantha TaxID=4533 RepID=J3MUC7_ORYBR
MEVRSEQGLMAGRDLFGMPKSPPAPAPPPAQSVRMAYTSDGTPVFTPVSAAAAPPGYQSGGGAGTGSTMPAAGGNGAAALPDLGEPVLKKKRGRPRKYGPDGSMSLGLVASPTSAGSTPGASGPFSLTQPKPASLASPVSQDGVKKRGRPKGSTNKPRIDAVGSAGVGFTPHIITVQAGEDVSSKIMSFTQHGNRAVCVLSANGAISNVTLRQTATSGGTVTYEGRFEILSLSGSFLLTDHGGQRSRTGGLSVSLAGPDGRLLGGGVAGLLIAATPVQIVVGSFNSEGKKEPKQHVSLEPAPLKTAPATGMGPNSSPPSRGTLSESSGGAGSPLHPGIAPPSNNSQPPFLSSMPWK